MAFLWPVARELHSAAFRSSAIRSRGIPLKIRISIRVPTASRCPSSASAARAQSSIRSFLATSQARRALASSVDDPNFHSNSIHALNASSLTLPPFAVGPLSPLTLRSSCSSGVILIPAVGQPQWQCVQRSRDPGSLPEPGCAAIRSAAGGAANPRYGGFQSTQ